ncbi:cell wall-binding repeat-containing protein [Caloramator sp. mosi_1]|uniref:cell wall-binding repeat-containing protein n=1 Tax=Caloramator sp. mosi_1 TaxID=3023090 RepID=UPI0023615F98|nr:cell wall-binding repeat-containing protein [Caloramator sp. mosi_1]WDC84969.1 cell wall-binding repeat-containing protein [Caloramator sp. mosi_1]
MNKKKIIASSLVVALLMGYIPRFSFASESIGKNYRYYGDNRYLTSVEISKNGFKSADTVIIASGENYPDALCAAPLAKKFNAPILLVSKNSITNEVLQEIQRIGAKNVFIVGGKDVVSDDVKSKIQSLNINVMRVSGKDRYETSYEVAKLVNSDKVVLASGEDFPDALSVAPIAARMGWPILLTQKTICHKKLNSI